MSFTSCDGQSSIEINVDPLPKIKDFSRRVLDWCPVVEETQTTFGSHGND